MNDAVIVYTFKKVTVTQDAMLTAEQILEMDNETEDCFLSVN